MVSVFQKYGFLFFECCVVAIRQQHYWQAVSSRRGRFIAPAYLYSTCICNPFETHLCNVRNVFVICVLHIRRAKVWFLRCKSRFFGATKTTFLAYKKHLFDLQKVVFCIFVKYISIFIDINKEYERTYNKS